jgi:photosystem II protein PsbQ
MLRFRSILTVVLTVVLTVLLMSSSPAEAAKAAKAPSYTPAQLEQIQQYATQVEELQNRMVEIPTLIQQQRWVDVKTFIHGPLGELRIRMSRLARSLAPQSQKVAQQAAKDVFEHLVAIDEAADIKDTTKAFRNYNEALKDLDAFFDLLPQ